MNSILFAKVKDGAIIPTKRDEDAGYDLYACFDEDEMIIKPHQTVIIPVGIIVAFPKGYVGVLKERGSTGKMGLGQRGGVYDSGFRGEWSVTLTNNNDRDVVITKYKGKEDSVDSIVRSYDKAIAQVLFVPLADLDASEVPKEFILNIQSARGVGKHGSTDK